MLPIGIDLADQLRDSHIALASDELSPNLGDGRRGCGGCATAGLLGEETKISRRGQTVNLFGRIRFGHPR
jgi:hypothetical protein